MNRPAATFALLLSAAMHGPASAAGFDCSRAGAPIERAVCTDGPLSLADFVLTERYQHLAAHCPAPTDAPEWPASQRRWLAQTRAAFVPGEAGLADLRKRYQLRNEELLQALDTCSLQRPLAPLRVVTVGRPDSSLKLPWVEAPSPEVSRRINDAVFSQLLDGAAPERLRDAATVLVAASADGQMQGTREADFSVRRNDGRLLAIEIRGEGCGAYCESYSTQLLFDARSGRPLENEALFTEEGLKTLTRHYNATRAARGRALIAHAKREHSAEPDELAMYQGCIRDWMGEFSSMPLPELDAQGAWWLRGGHCSPHAARPWDLLDDIDVPLPRALLDAHLSPYGKSLLLAQGDVRDPAPPPPRCKRDGPLPEPPHAPIRGLALGATHRLALLADGRLLAWGENSNGQLGNDRSPNGDPPVSVTVDSGSFFSSVAAGHDWSAAIGTDGRLWTWGSNYQSSLGDGGTTGQTRPVAIGGDYVQVRAEEHWGLALRRDGSVWTWGGRPASRDPATGRETYGTRPWTLGNGFVQVELGPRAELQALTRDGEVWTWLGTSGIAGSPDLPRKLGGRFTRLAGHHMQAAYQEDGSLWAWGESLAAMVDTGGETDRPPQRVGRGFVQVVYAPDGVVAAIKDDGSLWLTHSRGRVTQLEPIGCGYLRVALVGSTWENGARQVNVVAMRDGGRLVAWPLKGSTGEPTGAAPLDLGTGWRQLEMADGQWGNRGPELLLVDRDGALWQRRPVTETERPSAKDWLEPVEPGVARQAGPAH